MNGDKGHEADSNSFDEDGDGHQMGCLASDHNHTTEEVCRTEVHDDLRLGQHHLTHMELDARDDLRIEPLHLKHRQMDSSCMDYHVG